jgi:hypothetical protein
LKSHGRSKYLRVYNFKGRCESLIAEVVQNGSMKNRLSLQRSSLKLVLKARKMNSANSPFRKAETTLFKAYKEQTAFPTGGEGLGSSLTLSAQHSEKKMHKIEEQKSRLHVFVADFFNVCSRKAW